MVEDIKKDSSLTAAVFFNAIAVAFLGFNSGVFVKFIFEIWLMMVILVTLIFIIKL